MAETATLPIGRVSQVSSPKELYIMTSVTELESRAITFSTLESLDRISPSIFLRKGRKVFKEVSLQSSTTG